LLNDRLSPARRSARHPCDQIGRYGGSGGVRDLGLLEAVLYRPPTGYCADLTEEAAALWKALRKTTLSSTTTRTDFAVTYTFLAINGARITADAEAAYAFIARLYETNEFTFEKLAAWLRDNVVAAA
jgi:death on curing protein